MSSDPLVLSLDDLVAQRPRRLARGGAGARQGGGERPGRMRAQGLDYDGSGPWQDGDEPRHIDWRATARTGRTQVKRFLAQTYRARMVVADLRPALAFGTVAGPMARTCALTTARLIWEAAARHEPVGLAISGCGSEGRGSGIRPAVGARNDDGARLGAPEIQRRHAPAASLRDVLPASGAAEDEAGTGTVSLLAPARGRRHVLRLLSSLVSAYQACTGRAARDGPGASTLIPSISDAAAVLRPGDELCVVSDFAGPGALHQVSIGLAGRVNLFAFPIEDPLWTRPVPSGSYPVSLEQGGRETPALGAAAGAALPDAADRSRRMVNRTLSAQGWRVAVPARSRPPTQDAEAAP